MFGMFKGKGPHPNDSTWWGGGGRPLSEVIELEMRSAINNATLADPKEFNDPFYYAGIGRTKCFHKGSPCPVWNNSSNIGRILQGSALNYNFPDLGRVQKGRVPGHIPHCELEPWEECFSQEKSLINVGYRGNKIEEYDPYASHREIPKSSSAPLLLSSVQLPHLQTPLYKNIDQDLNSNASYTTDTRSIGLPSIPPSKFGPRPYYYGSLPGGGVEGRAFHDQTKVTLAAPKRRKVRCIGGKLKKEHSWSLPSLLNTEEVAKEPTRKMSWISIN